MQPTIVKSCLIKIFDNSIMPKRRGRKIKGGEPLATTMPPTVLPESTTNPVKPMTPIKSNNPVKVSPPIETKSNIPTPNIPTPNSPPKQIVSADRVDDSMLSNISDNLPMIMIVILSIFVVGVIIYYIFINETKTKDDDNETPSANTGETTAAATPSSSGNTPANTNETGETEETEETEAPATPEASGGDGSTEGFTVEILDSLVNNNKQDREFEPGRPDIWKPEENSLLPGQNI